MGTHLTVRPAPHPLGFVDAASHRTQLARAYSQYLTVAGEGDETELILRPLFVTAVLLDLLLVRSLHERLGETLMRSILVGFTHWQAEADQARPSLPGPARGQGRPGCRLRRQP